MSDALPMTYLARHGETAWTLSRQHTGRTDIQLTPREAQARRLQVFAAGWLGLEPAAGRLFVLGTASLSVMGYEHNRSEPVIRLWDEILYEPRIGSVQAPEHREKAQR